MLDEPRCQLYCAVVVEGDTAGPKPRVSDTILCTEKWLQSSFRPSSISSRVIRRFAHTISSIRATVDSGKLGRPDRCSSWTCTSHHTLPLTDDECAECIKNVRKWCRKFKEGRINVHDEQRSGRPSLPESTVARIDEMVRANRRITLEEIEDGLNEDCSHLSVHKIVSETLGYRKVSARWVDKWLKEAAGEWYNTGITKLVDRMKKVIEHQGDYVEK
ncbi:hypothetical protein LAZ67_6000275 [Cordylochernes scorpioides]|uniref:Uncharacterized protein n=1 Tax=Cordylochernes scorpioides TaxID=51811 RepID=A0ABY6KJ36_9ARAC|nr:hypothetical protein LAZ67_6000275 [Cordylochernes scorpioides]